MNYQDYIWDLGGTLLDNYESSTRAFAQTLADYGLTAGHDQIYQALKVSTDFAIQHFIADSPTFLRDYKAKEAKELARPLLFPGTRELLEKIVARKGRNFLISHRDKQVLDILERTGLAPFFTEVVTADSGFERKPSPQSMLYLKKKYKLEKTLVIGDRPLDIEAGQGAGFATYLFDNMDNLALFMGLADQGPSLN
ncbi:HAD-IA family hydrolase [Streptococcus oricebi]|uniref:DNA gyrase subunit B n=1 Tax=Streptococcus oricebi TaxID=1547447 RepID=A0ABS5B193_9STRE|nr:HAD-IA family hydrolase [Streptococcus oricebi]MBP2622520.1 DNA gyrase subunit B [Streptococcus oricebi]